MIFACGHLELIPGRYLDTGSTSGTFQAVAGICQHMRPARTCQTGTTSATRATCQTGKDLSSHEASRDTSQPVSGSNEASPKPSRRRRRTAPKPTDTHGAGRPERSQTPMETETDRAPLFFCQSRRRRRGSLHRRIMASPPGSFARLDRFHPSALAARRNGFHLSKHGPQRDGFHLSAGPRPSILEQIETRNQSETWSRSSRPRPTTYGHGQSRTRPK